MLIKKGLALFGQSQYQIPKKRFPFSQVACSAAAGVMSRSWAIFSATR